MQNVNRKFKIWGALLFLLLFAVGEGVRDRILASDNISLNANLAKYREDIKAGRVRKNRNRSSELNGNNR